MGIFGAAFKAGSASSARSAGSRVSAGLAMLGLFGNKRAGARVQAKRQAKQAKIDKYLASGGVFGKAVAKAQAKKQARQANAGSHIGGIIGNKSGTSAGFAGTRGTSGMSTSQSIMPFGGTSLTGGVGVGNPASALVNQEADPTVGNPQIAMAAEQFEKPAGPSDFSKPASLVDSFDPRSKHTAAGVFGDSVSRQKSVEAYSKNWSHLI